MQKKKSPKSRREPRPRQIVADVGRAGRTVWLAGLGAAVSAGESARNAFDVLVEEGEAAQRRPAKTTSGESETECLRTRVRRAGADVQSAAKRGVTGALHRVGIPTYQDINTLIDRVEMLTRRVESLRNR